MAFWRGIEGSDPADARAGAVEEQRIARTRHLATGTLACPECDAPVVPPAGGASPADPLACPFCRHGGPLRDFLSLASPARPARVIVRVVPAR